jgi:hypothetical protein
MPLSDIFPTFGKPVLDLGTGAPPKTTEGKYPPVNQNLLLVLSNDNKITALAMNVLLREWTFEEAITLYDNDDIADDQTFVLLTGKIPPTPKDTIIYGAWRDMPALLGLAAGQMAFSEVVLAQSETWTFSNDVRVTFYGEWRPKLPNTTDVFPAAHGERELYVSIPPDGYIVGGVQDRKRTWSAIGRVVRRWDAATNAYSQGELEYRYVLHLSRRTGV